MNIELGQTVRRTRGVCSKNLAILLQRRRSEDCGVANLTHRDVAQSWREGCGQSVMIHTFKSDSSGFCKRTMFYGSAF